MLCPNCEAENNDDARFCDECGFPLSGSIARAGGAASPSRTDSASSQRPYSTDTPASRNFGNAESESWPASPHEASGFGWGGIPDSAMRDDPLGEPFDHHEDFAFEPNRRQAVDFDNAYFDDLQTPDDDNDYSGEDEFDDSGSADNAFEPAFKDAFNSQSDFDDFFSDDYRYPSTAEADELDDTLDFGDDFWRDDSTAQMPRFDSAEQQGQKNYRIGTSGRAGNKSRMAIIAIGALVAVAALVAVIGFAFGAWGGKPVPDVTGLTEADAKSVLEDEGFTVRTTQVKSDETEGLVLIMDPGAGSLAPEGSEVIIHIATARFIPELEGKSLDEARALLQEAGYENVKYEVKRTEGEENIVQSVSPEAGTRAKSSMEVVVTYSENFKVPDISGKDLESAMSTIEDAGLQADVEYIDSDQYPDGTIISTRPEAGSKVSQGDYVTITVTRTRGVELVALTEELLSEGKTISIDGVQWQIESVMSISYQGDDTVSYTATGKPMVSVRGQTLVGSSETIDGTVVWSSDNEVVSIG